MMWVSEEQIARAKEVNILDYVLKHEPHNFKKVGNRYIMREHDSFVISNGKWKWNSRGFGAKQATALNYLIKYHGYSFVDAVRELAGDSPESLPDRAKTKAQSEPIFEKQPFTLPPRNKNNDRVIAYLLSRDIDWESIDACIAAGTLYESVKTHNCVFIGRNEEGRTRYACFRGTSGQFKRDAENSDKRYSFLLPPLSPENCDKAACFEAPVDALSHQSLYKVGITDFDGWRLTLGGDSLVALEHFLSYHPEVKFCLVCTDNDEAGDIAAERIISLSEGDNRFSHVRVIREIPPIGKDWNDTLIEIRRCQERSQDRTHSNRMENDGEEANILIDARKDIIFRDEHYKEKFRIKDGDSIKITVAYDGEELVRKCRFLDEAHMNVGSTCYHIDEFMEKQTRVGNKYEPVPNLEPKLDIIHAEPGLPLQDMEIPISLTALRELLGGQLEITPLDKSAAIVRGQHGNGSIAVLGLDGDNLTSLHPYKAQMYKHELAKRARAAAEKKPSIQEQLSGARKAVAELNQAAANEKSDHTKKKAGIDI